MSEFEYMKISPSLKTFYKIIEKNLSSTPSNKFKMTNNFKNNKIEKVFKKFDCKFQNKIIYDNNLFQVIPEFKFNDGDLFLLKIDKNNLIFHALIKFSVGNNIKVKISS